MDNKLCVKQIGLCACATALCDCFHLSGRHAAFCLERFPELPLLSVGRLKANNGIAIVGKIRGDRVIFWSIRH